MRYIDVHKIEDAVQLLDWDATRQAHFNAMAGMSVTDRKIYITSHPDWNQLQSIMLGVSHNKCWYSEAPIGNGDLEVDHFRPKNKSKQKLDFTDPKSKSTVHKINGYWWLAYDWDNYRLAGALTNKLRRDRLGDCDDVKGKGDYFPLDLTTGRVANDEENIICEEPILLDPVNPVDVCLLTFDKGIPIPATNSLEEIDRVKQSIFYYHLDLDQLNKDRKIVWDDCVEQLKDAKESIDNSITPADKKVMMKKCFREIRKLVDSERKAFTSTAKACLMVYSELSGFPWLKDLVRTL
ncbi:hypothetical protein [Psychroflexus sp. MES1-P1E]|uniref:hypothetical protein n=1 Tax=Psychroflexus sp. MES1-P1E TaxID=2058320 RepID=UPI000C7E1FBA|nr:hypothetical protein [Psychroflexus sp. MES1-P1E]PKG42492.1 hypothetical protein CXF67_10235 [Psychroflexus sp. MES1-P1E]